MDLATYGAIVSTAAILMSGLSLWLHWKRWRRDETDRQPELTWSISPESELPGWERLTITLRNRANVSIKADRATVLWPPRARIRGGHIARRENKEKPWVPGEVIVPTAAFRTMPLRLSAAHAGTQPRKEYNQIVMGSGDTHSTELLVSGRSSSRLILWISLSSADSSLLRFDRSLRIKSRMIVT